MQSLHFALLLIRLRRLVRIMFTCVCTHKLCLLLRLIPAAFCYRSVLSEAQPTLSHMSFACCISVCLRSSFGILLSTSAANLMLPEPFTDKVNFDGNLVLIDRQGGSCSCS